MVKTKKLSRKYKGYYTIEEFIGDTNVILKDQNNNNNNNTFLLHQLQPEADVIKSKMVYYVHMVDLKNKWKSSS